MTEILAVGILILLLWPKGSPIPGPTFTGELIPPKPDEPPGPPQTPLNRWKGYVSDTPRMRHGYRIKKNELFFGADGIIARAYKDEIGRGPTPQEAAAYLHAIGRVRSNWRLYGTLATQATPPIESFTVRNADGSTVKGTIGAASYPMHDSWPISLQQNSLPGRLISWTRGGDGKPKVADDAVVQEHSGNRVYGTVWLPPIEAAGAGTDVTYNPAFDWPAEIYASVGETWEGWVP